MSATATITLPNKVEAEQLFKRAQDQTLVYGVDWYVIPKVWLDDLNLWFKPEREAGYWPEPDRIDTGEILDDWGFINVSILRVETVSPRAWELLMQWFGLKPGTKPIKRRVVNNYGNLEIDIFPGTMRIFLADPKTGLEMTDLNTSNMFKVAYRPVCEGKCIQDLFLLVCEIFGKDPSNCRVWIKHMATLPWELIKDTEMQDPFDEMWFTQNLKLLVEWKNASGRWVRESWLNALGMGSRFKCEDSRDKFPRKYKFYEAQIVGEAQVSKEPPKARAAKAMLLVLLRRKVYDLVPWQRPGQPKHPRLRENALQLLGFPTYTHWKVHFDSWDKKYDEEVPKNATSRFQQLVSSWRDDLMVGDKVDVRPLPDSLRWWPGKVVGLNQAHVMPSKHELTIEIKRNPKDSDSQSYRVTVRRHSEQLSRKFTHVPRSAVAGTSSTSAYMGQSSSYSFDSNDTGTPTYPGTVGLRNLGNTCFMNSILQCMNATQCISSYFLDSNEDSPTGWKKDINADNCLGHGGNLARAYADLQAEQWSNTYTSVAPKAFKAAIGKAASQFSGYSQHDSQELLNFLLDGLHEDLNRVKDKPYVESVESGGREDQVVADEAWGNHLKRNQSKIVDVFSGQLKSHLQCPVCSYTNVTFDSFNSLSLPLPGLTAQAKPMTIFVQDVNGLGFGIVEIKDVFKKNMTTLQLKQWVSGKLDELRGDTPGPPIPASNMIFCDAYCNYIYSLISDPNRIVSKVAPPATLMVFLLDGLPYTAAMKPPKTPPPPPPPASASTADPSTAPAKIAPAALGPLRLGPRHRAQQHGTADAEEDEGDTGNAEDGTEDVEGGDAPTDDPGETDTAAKDPPGEADTATKDPPGETDTATKDPPGAVADSAATDDAAAADVTEAASTTSASTTPATTAATTTTSAPVTTTATTASTTTTTATTVTTSSPTTTTSTTAATTVATTSAPTTPPAAIPSQPCVHPVPLLFLKETVLGTFSFCHYPSMLSIKPGMTHRELFAIARQLVQRLTAPDKPPVPFTLSAVHRDNRACDEPFKYPSVELEAKAQALHDKFKTDPDIYPTRTPVDSAISLGLITAGTSIHLPEDDDVVNVKWLLRGNKALALRFALVDTKLGQLDSSKCGKPTTQMLKDVDQEDNVCSLEKCLDAFRRQEVLGKDDQWYCRSCKDHVRATKKMDLWKVPDILIVHFKRFEYSVGFANFVDRQKITQTVHFPLEGLDLNPYVMGSQSSSGGGDLLYDCYAISNHMGNCNGGHYTAYVKRACEDMQWLRCNDSSISSVGEGTSNVSTLVSGDAYVLFYQRRGSKAATTVAKKPAAPPLPALPTARVVSESKGEGSHMETKAESNMETKSSAASRPVEGREETKHEEGEGVEAKTEAGHEEAKHEETKHEEGHEETKTTEDVEKEHGGDVVARELFPTPPTNTPEATAAPATGSSVPTSATSPSSLSLLNEYGLHGRLEMSGPYEYDDLVKVREDTDGAPYDKLGRISCIRADGGYDVQYIGHNIPSEFGVTADRMISAASEPSGTTPFPAIPDAGKELEEKDKKQDEQEKATVEFLMEMTLKSREKCAAALKRANGDNNKAAMFLLDDQSPKPSTLPDQTSESKINNDVGPAAAVAAAAPAAASTTTSSSSSSSALVDSDPHPSAMTSSRHALPATSVSEHPLDRIGESKTNSTCLALATVPEASEVDVGDMPEAPNHPFRIKLPADQTKDDWIEHGGYEESKEEDGDFNRPPPLMSEMDQMDDVPAQGDDLGID